MNDLSAGGPSSVPSRGLSAPGVRARLDRVRVQGKYTGRVKTPGPHSARDVRDRLGAAVDYLESRLGSEDVDLDRAARCSGFSRSHFMRLFQAVVGFPVAEYVRWRRLSCAAEELAAGRPVLETAIHWGYESQAAFTRAFSRTFGVTPAAYARGVYAGAEPMEVLVPFEPRLPFESEVLATSSRQEKTALRLVGVGARMTLRRFQSFTSVPAFWNDWVEGQRWRPLGAGPWTPSYGLSRLRASGDIDYFIGVEPEPRAPLPHGYRAEHVPGGPYQVFSAQGVPAPTAQGLVLAAYGSWLPEVHRRPGGWDIETFRMIPGLPPGAYQCELWVPLHH